MDVNTQKGSAPTTTIRREVIVNFCRTVLRADDDLLQRAIIQYQQSLATPKRR